MTAKRFRKGKSILTDFPTGAIIDEKTGERYYDGIKPSYISSKELVKILNDLYEENEELKYNLSAYMVDLNNYKGKCSALEIENKQLKQSQSSTLREFEKGKKKIWKLAKENEQLKSENNMLKHTIGRNEAYIERITHKGEWSNTSDEEKEVIAYLQAYHQGDIKELKK